MGVFLYVTSIFGTAGVLAIAKLKKKENAPSGNNADLTALRNSLHRCFKSKDIEATNKMYQRYLSELEKAAANEPSYLSELKQIRTEYSFFKRKNKITAISETESETDKEIKPELREIRKMLETEAALCMDSDPDTSLELLNSAACFDPDRSITPIMKIAQINFKQGKHDEAYLTYERALQTLDRSDLRTYHTKSKEICEKMGAKKFKDEQYAEYIYYYCKWLYHHVLALALNGKVNELNVVLGSTEKLSYGVPLKMKTCFTKLGKLTKKQQFNEAMKYYFDKHSSEFKQIAQCASRQPAKGSGWVNQANLLANDFSPEKFEIFYKNILLASLE